MVPTTTPTPELGGIHRERVAHGAGTNRIAEMHPCLTKTSRSHFAQPPDSHAPVPGPVAVGEGDASVDAVVRIAAVEAVKLKPFKERVAEDIRDGDG
jgi:hypothetical protein